jgi:hypothetical protein
MIRLNPQHLIECAELYWAQKDLYIHCRPIIEQIKNEIIAKEQIGEFQEGSIKSIDYESYPFLIGDKEYTLKTFKEEILFLESEKEKWINEIIDSYSREIDNKIQRIIECPENFKKTNIFASGIFLNNIRALYQTNYEKYIKGWFSDFGYNVINIFQKATVENHIQSDFDNCYWKVITTEKVFINDKFGFSYRHPEFYFEKCSKTDLDSLDQQFIDQYFIEKEKVKNDR